MHRWPTLSFTPAPVFFRLFISHLFHRHNTDASSPLSLRSTDIFVLPRVPLIPSACPSCCDPIGYGHPQEHMWAAKFDGAMLREIRMSGERQRSWSGRVDGWLIAFAGRFLILHVPCVEVSCLDPSMCVRAAREFF